jgi:hypothetical protein
MLLTFLISYGGLSWTILLPLLIGSWLLGWTFWRFFERPKLDNQINTLIVDNSRLQNKVVERDRSLSIKTAALASLENDYSRLNSRYGNLDLKLKSKDETRTNLENELEE